MQSLLEVKMFPFLVLSCLSALLHATTSVPLEGTKPKPVALEYSCLTVTFKGGKAQDHTPILLLHGLGSSKESWMGLYQVIAMKTARKVCMADLRNHGDSPWSDESNVEAMSEDISKLLDTLKTPKVVLLGHSLGGKVAVHFALNYPEKVQKLVIEDMRPNGMTPKAVEGVKYFMKLLLTALDVIPEGADERTAKRAVGIYLEKELAKINSSGLVDEKSLDFLPIKCSDGKCQWKTNTKLIQNVLNDFWANLNESSGRFDGPSLFVYGTKSPFKVEEDESSIRKLFPEAELVGIEGASHMVHMHREFLDPVIRFINE